ncbi:hypothetical protein [Halarcobacter sp.]|uniref:hypothetical protein n=1 Tax=Halarcobacter sp. TaxID=2321133 RepID=UPI0029F47654|nr:hypothetical protein [Halarcobacter sp.]
MSKRTIEVSESEYAALMMSRRLMKVVEGAKETPKIKELTKRLEKLKGRKKELHHFLSFLTNHDNHDVHIHSYSNQKIPKGESVDDIHEASARGVEFKGQLSTEGMRALAEYLFEITNEDIETAEEMLEAHKRVSGYTGGVINLNLGGN